jgi:fatty acid omega-hydroxylase
MDSIFDSTSYGYNQKTQSSFMAEEDKNLFSYKGLLLVPAVFIQLLKKIAGLDPMDIAIAVTGFLIVRCLAQRKAQGGLAVWPVVGMLPSLLLHLNDVYEWFSEAVNRSGGTFTFKGPWLSSLRAVITCDPINVEYMLKTHFSNFPKGPYFRDVVRDLLGDGIFNADDELWRQQRKAASIEFHSLGFRNHTVQSLKELVHARLLPILDHAATLPGTPIDLQDVLLRLTFDNVCMIAFGVDPGCLRLGLPEIPFAKAFEEGTEATVYRFITPTVLWRVMRYFNVGMEKKLGDSLRAIDDFADHVIESRMRELAEPTTDQGADLLTIFMQLKDDNGNPYSHRFLRDICINFILAGRDTSSVALTWFFWLLHGHPHVEQKIIAEIKTVLSNSRKQENVELSDVTFTVEELKQMHYLQAAVSEALRLYPSVPVDHKEVAEDDQFPDGTRLKKGTKVLYVIYAMGRMESIWGKDAREFRPERWLSKEGRFMTESAYKYTAFNGGPRLCLGKDFAYTQMKWVAASVISRFTVRVVPGHPVVPKLALTMYMKHGLLVTLHPRERNTDTNNSGG